MNNCEQIDIKNNETNSKKKDIIEEYFPQTSNNNINKSIKEDT